MLIQRGNSTVRSFAADMELAVMLVPTCATNHASAAKKAAQRPTAPWSSHSSMIVSGLQMYSPMKTLVADVVTMPSTPQTVKMTGRKGSCTNWPLAERAYRVKSGMLTASVAQYPVTDDMHDSHSQVYEGPVAVARSWKMSPPPPAL